MAYALQNSEPNRRLNRSGGDSFRVNPYMLRVMLYRVHTIIVGRNLPTIYQRFPSKPTLNAMPLLRLMVQAKADPLRDEVFQGLAGPVPG